MDEQPRTGTNGDDAFTLTADEVLMMYEQAGHPRTLRSIQKFCKRGDIECRFEQTLYGRRYRISPLSVERHIKELDEIAVANSRGESRTDATVRMLELSQPNNGEDAANSTEPSRTDAPIRLAETHDERANEQHRTADIVRSESRPDAPDTKYVVLLERENEFLRDQIGRKDHQIEQRDNQIQSMIERDRETNFLIQGLQRMLRLGPGEGTDRDHQ
jgi:hypothetical protein